MKIVLSVLLSCIAIRASAEVGALVGVPGETIAHGFEQHFRAFGAELKVSVDVPTNYMVRVQNAYTAFRRNENAPQSYRADVKVKYPNGVNEVGTCLATVSVADLDKCLAGVLVSQCEGLPSVQQSTDTWNELVLVHGTWACE